MCVGGGGGGVAARMAGVVARVAGVVAVTVEALGWLGMARVVGKWVVATDPATPPSWPPVPPFWLSCRTFIDKIGNAWH